MQNGTAPSQSNDHGISPVRNNLISVTLYLWKTRKKNIIKQSPIYYRSNHRIAVRTYAMKHHPKHCHTSQTS